MVLFHGLRFTFLLSQLFLRTQRARSDLLFRRAQLFSNFFHLGLQTCINQHSEMSVRLSPITPIFNGAWPLFYENRLRISLSLGLVIYITAFLLL